MHPNDLCMFSDLLFCKYEIYTLLVAVFDFNIKI